MMTTITLTPSEIWYFQNLSQDKLPTVRIALKIISLQLDLNSKDARNILAQLHQNFTSWDATEEGRAGWSPLLSSLRKYLELEAPPSQELIGRVTALQNCLPAG